MEEWRKVKINPLFEISNLGNLRRKLSPHTRNKYRLFKGDKSSIGYIRHKIFFNSENSETYRKSNLSTARFLVHRLVAQAFIPNPENLPIVNHIDGNPSNNHVSNLEWCTYSHNLRHAYKIGRISKAGENNSIAKLSDKKVLVIRRLRDVCHKEHKFIANIFGVSQSLISMVLGRKIWNHV